MEKIYAFDVDGTLTDPRQEIDPQFNQFFLEFAKKNLVYLVTGSGRDLIKEQLPVETLNACYGMFACSGAELWAGERLIYRKEHEFPASMRAAIEQLIDTSPYPHRAGKHIDPRPGMLNITTVGRNATTEQRKHYHAWDKEHGERQEFIRILSGRYPQYEFSAGGEISVDIVPYGWTKAVAKTEIESRHFGCSITFFGDRMDAGGNDKPLADVLKTDPRHRAVHVNSYLDTWKLLQPVEATQAA
ncbi:MAG: HAD-IIB family hydrolase [Rhizobiaceae bacterium]